MPIKPRLLPAMGAALITLTVASTAGAAESAKKVRLPDQVLTGASDASATPAAAAPAARSLAAARSTAPSADELNSQLAASTSESSSGLRKTVTLSGGSKVDLDGRFMSVMVATPTADGGYDVNCYTGEGAVEHAKHAKLIAEGKLPKPEKASAPTPAPLEEK
jgi:hypothetical protein